MKILKKLLLGLFSIIILSIGGGLIFLNHIKKSALPDYNKNLEIPGLIHEVTILRDAHGIPHIYAKNEIDLYQSVGFTLAQDRLWQMDLLRRVTQGRLSEILGKEQIQTDLLMRALRIQAKSEKVLETLQPDIKKALNSFTDGMNHYIKNYPLPTEFKILGYKPELWEPAHSLNLIGYMAWDLTMGWETEILLHQLKNEIELTQIQDLIPDKTNHKKSIFPDFNSKEIIIKETILSANKELEKLGVQVFSGSNNWAVSGKKSKTGKVLLANDMHLGLFAPGIWYQMHQHVEGKVNVSGLVLPGQPFVIAGHNDSIAWGMTNVMVDDLDFYAEKLNDDSTKYLLDGKWQKLLIQDEIIKTKEGQDVHKTLKFTHRGPIVNQFKNNAQSPLSIRWLGNETSSEIRTVYLLNRTNHWNDFRDAVRTFKSVSQNIVYADIKGNIGLQTSAGIPIRAGNGVQIYPGETSASDWTGLVPFEELPYEYNPERGFVSSANNKTVPDDYPYYISTWFDTPNRIDRIREMLNEKEKLGIDDFKEMHGDVKTNKGERWLPLFLKALDEIKTKNIQQIEAMQKLKNWDYRMTRESQAASIFDIWYRKVCENLIKDDLSPASYKSIMGQRMLLEKLMFSILQGNGSAWIDDKSTKQKETFNDIVIRSFKETISDLIIKLDEDPENWQWGKIHTLTMSHPMGVVKILDKAFKLNRGPFEVPGSYHTVSPYSYSYNNLYKANWGASHRHIFDLGGWDKSLTIIPTGTSGIPSSTFYLDQTEMYLNNIYHADPFSAKSVKELAKFEMKLQPK